MGVVLPCPALWVPAVDFLLCRTLGLGLLLLRIERQSLFRLSCLKSRNLGARPSCTGDPASVALLGPPLWPSPSASDWVFLESSFRKHEWEKHGTCAAQLDVLDSEKKYFGKSLELYQFLSLNR